MTTQPLPLILAAKAGDESAWRELVLRYRGFMARAVKVAIRRRRDRDDAWSWAYEFLMRCVDRFDPQHSSGASFGHYLYRSLMLGVPKEAMNRGAIHVPANATRRHPAAVAAARTVSLFTADDESFAVPVQPDTIAEEYEHLIVRLAPRDQAYLERQMRDRSACTSAAVERRIAQHQLAE